MKGVIRLRSVDLWAGFNAVITCGQLRDTHAQKVISKPVFKTVGIERWEVVTNQSEVATTR